MFPMGIILRALGKNILSIINTRNRKPGLLYSSEMRLGRTLKKAWRFAGFGNGRLRLRGREKQPGSGRPLTNGGQCACSKGPPGEVGGDAGLCLLGEGQPLLRGGDT